MLSPESSDSLLRPTVTPLRHSVFSDILPDCQVQVYSGRGSGQVQTKADEGQGQGAGQEVTMLYNKSGSHGQLAVTQGHRKVTQGHTCQVQTPLGTAMRS